jgi:hypothetical protein
MISDGKKKEKALYGNIFSKISMYDDKAVPLMAGRSEDNPKVRVKLRVRVRSLCFPAITLTFHFHYPAPTLSPSLSPTLSPTRSNALLPSLPLSPIGFFRY